jgi:biotin carboxyl carrier protein
MAGEHPWVPECVVLSPTSGVFRPLPPETVTVEGEIVYVGQTIGVIEASGESTPVCSRFTGFLMGMLAHADERVREGQPVAWLRNLAV